MYCAAPRGGFRILERCGDAHAAAFTGVNVLASEILSVALTLPVRPSSNCTTV